MVSYVKTSHKNKIRQKRDQEGICEEESLSDTTVENVELGDT